MSTIRNGRGGTGASVVGALGGRRSVWRRIGGCSVVWDGGSVDVTPSWSGRSGTTGVTSDEGVVGPLTHVVPSGSFVPGLEVVEVDGVLRYRDVLLDDQIKTPSEVHDVKGGIGCSGEVDQLFEVVDVLVDGFSALVVCPRYKLCERAPSF